jgi:hypothetical protein
MDTIVTTGMSDRKSRGHRLSKKNNGGTEMIYFEDRGTVLDAPIDVVWDFILKDDIYHPKAHPTSLRKMKWKDVNEITGEGSCEVMRGGKWRKMKFRVTTVPPYVRIVEEFAGRYAGQKFVLLYTPKGRNKTAVDVFVYTRKLVAKEMRETFANAHEEDVPMLREFARKQPSRTQKDSKKKMVYIEDKGAVYDAPMDVFWDYMLKDNDFHSKAHHTTLRNMDWKDLNDITGEGTCEVIRGGKWSKMKFRMTTVPPLVRITEEFAGRYAGQKMVFLYTPKGRKRTSVDVFFLTPKEVAEETRRTLAQADEEDAPMVRAFAKLYHQRQK